MAKAWQQARARYEAKEREVQAREAARAAKAKEREAKREEQKEARIKAEAAAAAAEEEERKAKQQQVEALYRLYRLHGIRASEWPCPWEALFGICVSGHCRRRHGCAEE